MDAQRGVIVVGGGAAGMVAAIAAARRGAPVEILERMPRIGKKLLVTGNGRCNLANARPEPARYHGEDPAFAPAALAAFGLDDTLRFFAEIGIEVREEECGKLFPRSGQAAAVLDVLRHELSRLGVRTHCETPVQRLEPRAGLWRARTPAGTHEGAALVLATGGRAAPQLGSNGSGHALAAGLGHRIVEPFPALTRVRLRSPWLAHLKGLKVEGRVALGGITAAGEILFTATGISGPPVLDVSRRAGELLRHGRNVRAVLDLCPDVETAALPGQLRERFASRPGITGEFALVGFLPKRLIVPALREAGIDPTESAAGVAAPRLRALAALLSGWDLEVTGTDSWTDAQVTAGGVATAEVDPATLESRLAPGLFLAGEVLDVDGDCGGFNLQWAWSSGHVAGTAAAARALPSA
ncbi:MAG TPA: aminoacetone oxidase family FAD-binding enzyme [Candidatus Methanoperedens sp.]|nr:aminoacetone oxidase family FAD-binding enzyme [Candidatus Methanoperedens sp.]